MEQREGAAAATTATTAPTAPAAAAAANPPEQDGASADDHEGEGDAVPSERELARAFELLDLDDNGEVRLLWNGNRIVVENSQATNGLGFISLDNSRP
jgi:hypothetical protein